MNNDSLIDLPPSKKILQSLFRITILLKGINGFWEVVVGILFFFFKTETIRTILFAITGGVIAVHPGRVTTNYLMRQASNFSVGTKYFIAFYFFFYGVVNIFLAVSLLKGKLWAYPVAIAFFVCFIIYQCYRLVFHYSGLLLFFTLFDGALVILTWLEYRRMRSTPVASAAKNIL